MGSAPGEMRGDGRPDRLCQRRGTRSSCGLKTRRGAGGHRPIAGGVLRRIDDPAAAQVGDRGLGHTHGANERQRRVVRVGSGGVERVHQAIPDRGVLGEGEEVAVIVEIDAAPVELEHEQGGRVGGHGERIHGGGLEPGGKSHGKKHTFEAPQETSPNQQVPQRCAPPL